MTEKMPVWESPSGRLHLYPGCTGAGPRNRMHRIRVTQEQFNAATRCRCLNSFRPERPQASLVTAARGTGPCSCKCNSGGFCGGCGHAGCGERR